MLIYEPMIVTVFKSKVRREDTTPRFITSFNNQWGELRTILKKHWGILTSDPKLETILPQELALTARRVPNLRDRLTSSHFVHKHTRLGCDTHLRGSYPCGGCNICPLMTRTPTFTDPLSGDQFRLQDYINCRSKMFVYCLMCTCSKLYIG